MSNHHHQLGRVEDFQPTSFAERGVAVPFTTPMLAGTRVRASEGQIQLIIPNPSGGRGVYVVPSSGLSQLCRPTLHDLLLARGLASERQVTPTSVARLARRIAAEGSAGPIAVARANAAEQAERNQRMETHFHLLRALVEQVERQYALPDAAAMKFEQRARRAMDQMVPVLGCPRSSIAAHLEAIADILYALGIVRGGTARLPRLAAAVGALRDATADQAAQRHGPIADAAEAITQAAGFAADGATGTIAEAQEAACDPSGLLARWRADPTRVAEQLGRSEWLLDGWEPICLICREAASRLDRDATWLEIAPILPALPRQAVQWGVIARVPRLRPVAGLGEEWHSVPVVRHLTRRNERLLADAI